MCASRRAGSIRHLHTAVLRASDADGYARGEDWAPGLRDAKQPVRFFAAAPAIAIISDRPNHRTRQRRATARRGRHRHAVQGARRRIRRRLRRGRRARARASAATPSATSSTATSTTPTSATTAAGSAPSPRASSATPCAARPTTSTATRSSAASAKRGIAARPKSACRAASIRATPARPIFDILTAAKRAVSDIHVHAFSPLEVHHGATSLGLTHRRLSRPAARRGARQPAGHRGRNPRRRRARRALPGQAFDRSNGSPSSRRRIAAGFAPPRPSCSAMSTGRSTGRGTCCTSAICRSAPAASPNSCRCRSCTWKRRFI